MMIINIFSVIIIIYYYYPPARTSMYFSSGPRRRLGGAYMLVRVLLGFPWVPLGFPLVSLGNGTWYRNCLLYTSDAADE